MLTLHSQVAVDFHGATPATLTAASGTINKNPRLVVLDLPRMQNASRHASADKGTLFLRPDNTLERILASGNVRVESQGVSSAKVQSNQLELLMGDSRTPSVLQPFQEMSGWRIPAPSRCKESPAGSS